MGFTSKIDARTLSLVLIALIGGVVGGYVSNATMSSTQMEGLSNALTTQLVSKDTQIATLSSQVSALNVQVSQLQGTIAEMESVPVVGINTPDFDSGWITYGDPGWDGSYLYVMHNLGTQNIFVYLLGREGVDYNPYQMVLEKDPYDDHKLGILWYAYGYDTLLVRRNPESEWTMIRALIWALPDPPEVTTTP